MSTAEQLVCKKKCLMCNVEKILTNRQIICNECKTKICPICGLKFKIKGPYHYKQKYCSPQCGFKSRPSCRVTRVCLFCKNPYIVYRSQVKWRGSNFCSKKCQSNFKSTQKGKLCPSWKGGISKKSKRIRNSRKWKIWRERVFKRDNWSCQCCFKRGDYLEPHHIRRFKFYPRKRFSINNGITLCKKCHSKTRPYDKEKNSYIYEIKERFYICPKGFIY